MHRPNPSEAVKNSVLQWSEHVQSFPTWQEVKEVEYLRLRGNINMFVIADVIEACARLGLRHASEWFERLKHVKVIASTAFGIAVRHYQLDHGPQDTWNLT